MLACVLWKVVLVSLHLAIVLRVFTKMAIFSRGILSALCPRKHVKPAFAVVLFIIFARTMLKIPNIRHLKSPLRILDSSLRSSPYLVSVAVPRVFPCVSASGSQLRESTSPLSSPPVSALSVYSLLPSLVSSQMGLAGSLCCRELQTAGNWHTDGRTDGAEKTPGFFSRHSLTLSHLISLPLVCLHRPFQLSILLFLSH